jgi:hypothetical protein
MGPSIGLLAHDRPTRARRGRAARQKRDAEQVPVREGRPLHFPGRCDCSGREKLLEPIERAGPATAMPVALLDAAELSLVEGYEWNSKE